ncbi:hypothetical protein K1X76_03920 [bacterium]|nr:hypothetical protein [bacterium]
MKNLIFSFFILILTSQTAWAIEGIHGQKTPCFNFEKGKFDNCLVNVEASQMTLLRPFPGEKSIVLGATIKRLVQYSSQANAPSTLPVSLDVITVSVPFSGSPQDVMLGVVYEEDAKTKVLLLKMKETEVTPLKLWLETASGKRFELQ